MGHTHPQDHVHYTVSLSDRTPPNVNGHRRMLDVALAMASRGWHVFPVLPPTKDGECPCSNPECTSPGKHPAIRQWQERATTSEAQIRQWWEDWPDHNIGVATGRDSDLLVLDVDGATGRASIADGRDIPDGPAVSTGRTDGGTHHYMACPEDFDARNFAGLVPGLDARANGGYVIAAGSRHASGATYAWVAEPDGPLPLPPQWFIDLLKESKRPSGPISFIIPKNRRNVELTRLAGVLRRQGFETDEILASLRTTNAKRCRPPLADDELTTIAGSIGRKDATSPLITALRDDLGNAERFAWLNYGKALWSDELGTWFIWDGRRWAQSQSAVDRLAKETARAYQQTAANLPLSATDRDAHLEHAAKLGRADPLRHMLRWAQSELEIDVTVFERQVLLLNCLNGTLDCTTGQLQPPAPDDLMTHLVEVEYDAEAEALLWEAFIARAMHGDKEMIRFLQQLAGILITGDTSVKFLPVIWGYPDTGKTVFTNTLKRLLGRQLAKTISQATIAHQDRSQAGSAPSADLMDLLGTRLAVVSETDDELRLNEGRVKAWTGRNDITARPPHGKKQITFPVTHKLVIETNHKPNIATGDDGMWARLVLIPFTNVIPEDEQDKDLEEKLEAEFPGILAWAVRGCLDWRTNGLQVPDKVRKATAEYKIEEDPLAEFLGDVCELDLAGSVDRSRLRNTYEAWCRAEGREALSRPKFNKLLKDLGCTESRDTKRKNARVWQGITITHEGYGQGFDDASQGSFDAMLS